MKAIAIFCGSREGENSIYMEQAAAVGTFLANEGLTVVYGGSSLGIMGAIADAALDAGGQVIGVIPKVLKRKEVMHHGLTSIITVDSMHERKAMMYDLADGFMILPGGAGTMDEFFEIYTWAQLGLHTKPCGFLNIHGYYDSLIHFINHTNREGFLSDVHHSMLLTDSTPAGLLEQFRTYMPPSVKTYITDDQI